jgi:hypothetical protein
MTSNRTQSTLFRKAASLSLCGALGIAVLVAPAHASQTRPERGIRHIMVINLENESYATTFGPDSPATYLNGTLLKQGQLVQNWYATSHVSLGNYIAEVSGQGPTASTNSDCINAATLSTSLVGQYFDVTPGTDAQDNALYPGQVVGDGCVFPAPDAASGVHGAQTIGDQIDAKYQRAGFSEKHVLWREYAEDMGNTPSRDFGDADPDGGTDCAHPILGGADTSNSATADDQYATRHNPFVYFHSVIDDVARCDKHVVPLGTVSVGTGDSSGDVFAGHLYEDLRHERTTPLFMFVTPNLCNDGHDASCAGVNTEGTKAGGLAGADLWLKHWMPMILDSAAYRNGSLLVVLTFDEGGVGFGGELDATACPASDQAACNAPSGPNLTNFGYSPVLEYFGLETEPAAANVYPGGGQIGAVLFNRRFIKAGSINSTGYYNHFSALRSYEDLLGIDRGGDDGQGHLGFAALPQYASFGPDVFNRK